MAVGEFVGLSALCQIMDVERTGLNVQNRAFRKKHMIIWESFEIDDSLEPEIHNANPTACKRPLGEQMTALWRVEGHGQVSAKTQTISTYETA